MEPSKENVDWAVDLLMQFSHKKNFPESDLGLKAEARAFLRIVGDQKEHVYDAYDPDLGPITKRVEPVLGVDTAEWLIEQALDRLEFFPSAIQLRRIYEEKYQPADGRRSGDMNVG